MTEKESLLVLNQEIKSDLSFCRDCAVSQGATGWVKDFDRLLDKNEILNNKLNQQFSSYSKLSIPKKIAEELDDKNSTLNNFNWQFFMQNHRQSFWSYSNELNEYAKDIHNYEAICAYLNPVTKLFVEIEE